MYGVWSQRLWLGRVLAVWLLVCTLIGALFRGPLPFSAQAGSWVGPSPRVSAMQVAVDMVPRDAGVAATENIVAHLTHRTYAYDFPNPFQPMAYGADGLQRSEPSTVSWVVVDRQGLPPKYLTVLTRLLAPGGGFRVVSDRDDVVVARRA